MKSRIVFVVVLLAALLSAGCSIEVDTINVYLPSNFPVQAQENVRVGKMKKESGTSIEEPNFCYSSWLGDCTEGVTLGLGETTEYSLDPEVAIYFLLEVPEGEDDVISIFSEEDVVFYAFPDEGERYFVVDHHEGNSTEEIILQPGTYTIVVHEGNFKAMNFTVTVEAFVSEGESIDSSEEIEPCDFLGLNCVEGIEGGGIEAGEHSLAENTAMIFSIENLADVQISVFSEKDAVIYVFYEDGQYFFVDSHYENDVEKVTLEPGSYHIVVVEYRLEEMDFTIEVGAIDSSEGEPIDSSHESHPCTHYSLECVEEGVLEEGEYSLPSNGGMIFSFDAFTETLISVFSEEDVVLYVFPQGDSDFTFTDYEYGGRTEVLFLGPGTYEILVVEYDFEEMDFTLEVELLSEEDA